MRTFSAFVAVVSLFVTGCAGPDPVKAPKEIDELSAYLFANFESETGDELVAGTEELRKFLKDLDLANAELDDRTFSMSPLQNDDWGGIEGSPEDPAMQLPLAVAALSDHDLTANIDLAGNKNHVCIDSNTTVYYDREFDSQKKCFLDGDCDTLRTTNEIRKESVIAKVWYDMYKDYRVITDEDGKETALISRSWTDKVWMGDNGKNSWDQIYAIDVSIPEGDQTLRYVVFWSAVTIGGVADDFYVNLVKTGIEEGYLNSDRFVVGKMCANPRDREYDRP